MSDNPFAAVVRSPVPSSRQVKKTPVPAGGDDLVSILQAAGFKGEALKTAWAIAKRESGGRAEAFNPDTSTGDQSYGLFQINMLGALGPDRRKRYGLSSNEDLFDPATNARVAYAMSKGGKDFGAWGIGPNAYRKMPALDFSGYPGGSNPAPAKTLPAAKAAKAPARTLPLTELDGDNPFSFLGVSSGEGNPFAALFGSRPDKINVSAPAKGETKLAPVGMVVEGSNLGARAVQQAATQLGKPYVFGSGPDTSSFDCSDLVQWSYKQLGINIPRDTWGQQKVLPLKSWDDLKPGDPIYRKSGGHVVIYAGNGKVIAAPHSGTVVQYQSLANFPQDKWEVRSISS